MLSREQNDRLTRVGKDTPMGSLMRRYWHPIATSSELPRPDADPILRKLLGEKFVVFRDTRGRVGVIDEWCPHRGVSMALGRVGEDGIRCIYHGWKFDVEGQVLETPNQPDPRVRQRLRANAYPVVESAGLVWTYIGPKELQPPFRKLAFEDVPAQNRIVLRCDTHANYLQLWEGGADSSHVSILHTNVTRGSWLQDSRRALRDGDFEMIKPAWDDVAPRLAIERTGFGFHCASTRSLDEGRFNVRVVPIFMPYGRIIPFDSFFNTVLEVPMDDEHTATYYIDASPVRPMRIEERLQRSGLTEERFFDRNRFVATMDDGFFQDREAMREKRSWSGFHGITQEDLVMSCSMGPIVDRSREKLVSADAAVARVRQMLLEAIDQNEAGLPPTGVSLADLSAMKGMDFDVDSADAWRERAAVHLALYPPAGP